MKSTYKFLLEKKKKGEKIFCVLIDPDKFNKNVILESNKYNVDLFFVGGSNVKKKDFHACVTFIKKKSKIPLIIFPGDTNQISSKADALLLLSLISGRNSDYLIGKHTEVAQKIKESCLEVIPTGYILVSGGKKSATENVTGTVAISEKNVSLIVSTAIAGELLGQQIIYLEAGSGAKQTISKKVITSVKKNISKILIVGGGINDKKKVLNAFEAGADIVVVGNGIENNILLLREISIFLKKFKFKK